MKELDFDAYRNALRHKMAEKSLAEVRAMLHTLRILRQMNSDQMINLIADLILLEEYKTKTHSTQEEWARIEDSFYGS